MATTAPVTLPGLPSTLLPPQITEPIFAQTLETSVVMRLARRVPLAMTATTAIPVPLDLPTADWVNEGGVKPLSSGGISVKEMTGKKVATLVPVSMEVATSNAAGLYAQLQADLPRAIGRAFDVAAIHGRTMKGGTGPFGDYLAMTDKSVTLGTAAQNKGGIYADLVNGMAAVTEDDFDFNGFAADKRLKPQLLLATDTMGRPIFVDTTTGGTDAAGNGTLVGEPLAYGSGVSGKYRRQSTSTDSGLRAIGGDWTQCAYGVGMDINVKVSTEATYVDEAGTVHSAFQENLVLLLVEAYFGFVMGDEKAFVKYVSSGATS
ncbi:phage major capsid protein [Streptomyces sp. NEAU-sy36]|uniref:phage major capsid protein n=1 Tax=unclassified Streptomyces TaxID=2593676 RepID=UPI0015D64273|nr:MULTISPECIES: phage major capsid protein [unclassified Streptomyces]QLJ01536.1 phage major capsid protein [Streptomyces sp. NEAU-sy36]